MSILLKMIQGAIIGAGGVLPGVSGGVLAVLFGVYKPLMKLLAHPFRELKNTIIELWPILLGFVIGYIGIAKALEEALKAYETQSLFLFVGMTIGVLPSLFREAGEKGRSRDSFVTLGIVFVLATGLLYALNQVWKVQILPNFGLNMFGGFCLALSIIAPGMSSSILMLPLQIQGGGLTEEGTAMTLYEHITGAIGNLDFAVLLPVGIGGLLTIVLLTRVIDWMMNKHYSVMFHGIIGLVMAATIFTVPWGNLPVSAGSWTIHLALMAVGIVLCLLLDKFNQKVEKPEIE